MKVWQAVVTWVIVLCGCSGNETTESANPSEGRRDGPGRPTVYASNYPLQYFAERIAASRVEVRLSAPAGEDPAFWKPTSGDVAALQQADLIILNGASYESWLENVSLPTSRLVDTSVAFEERFMTQQNVTTHSHGLDGEHEHSATAFTTWLDLTLAIEQRRAQSRARSRSDGRNTRATSKPGWTNWSRSWPLCTWKSKKSRSKLQVCRFFSRIPSISTSRANMVSMVEASTGSPARCRPMACGRSSRRSCAHTPRSG